MLLNDVLTLTEAQIYSPNPNGPLAQADLDREIVSAFGADLMSDVLCYDITHGLLITGLSNPQVVRTAEMGDVAAVLMVRGKIPSPETADLARQVGIPILGTEMTLFEVCGRLYQAGLVAATPYE
jgi:predicted transcriptional regulator